MFKKSPSENQRKANKRRKYVKPKLTKHGALSQTALARSY